MGGRTPGDYPKTLAEFYRRFPDDAACLRYLVETRWPDGFRCPACGNDDAHLIESRRAWQCRRCRKQTSATAGTILHRTQLPLLAWFTAAYLMTSLKPGISALQLQSQLGLASFGTAWTMLHKLRRAMVNPDRSRLSGTVEADETWIGGKQAGLKGGRQRRDRKALEVAVAVERREKSLGRLRLEIITDDGGDTLYDFIKRNVEPGSTVISDAWGGYNGLEPEPYTHLSVSQAAQKRLGREPSAVPGVDRVTSNLKTWLRGTHHGVGADHLDAYLDEFVFRFNRRYYPKAGFASLLGLGATQPPTTIEQIHAPLKAGATQRRRGRATGQTSTRFANPPADAPPTPRRRKKTSSANAKKRPGAAAKPRQKSTPAPSGRGSLRPAPAAGETPGTVRLPVERVEPDDVSGRHGPVAATARREHRREDNLVAARRRGVTRDPERADLGGSA